jgi:hypothetical protein
MIVKPSLFIALAAVITRIKAAVATVFPVAINSSGSQAGGFIAFGVLNYLFAIQGERTGDNMRLRAQLVGTNGAKNGAHISSGRKDDKSYVAFAGTNCLVAWSESGRASVPAQINFFPASSSPVPDPVWADRLPSALPERSRTCGGVAATGWRPSLIKSIWFGI